MNTTEHDVKVIFCEALEIESAEAQAEYLNIACGGNRLLRNQVEALLHANDQAGEFLQGEDNGCYASSSPTKPSQEIATWIGPYQLQKQIGEGGFGVVYLAAQTRPVRRHVALKVIKPGMDSGQIIARFEVERQALALMDHPNIARVIDAGTSENGMPFFVMELVKGEAITEYCDWRRLSVRQRLELFLKVCKGVQHAHHKGIIHRDIKPANVLVTTQDQQAVPKIIDFGVAKAINQQLTENSFHTAYAQLVGTPAYMSPEQAERGLLDIDTRSDIYSLGVLLYELLTGSTPFEKERLASISFQELRRIICEEEPTVPSSRAKALAAIDTAVSDRRRTCPKKHQQMLQGDLDWIVIKCLEKEPNRRYDNVSDLIVDLENYLMDRPVQARPPSVIYRLSKLTRRNKATISAGVCIILVLILGTAATSWQAAVARRERDRAIDSQQLATQRRVKAEKAEAEADAQAEQARLEAARAKSVIGFLQEMLSSAHPDTGKGSDYTVRELLDDFSEGLDGRFEHQPEIEASLRQIIGGAYMRLGMTDKADLHLEQSVELQRELRQPDELAFAKTLTAWARTKHKMGDNSTGQVLANQALSLYRQASYPPGTISCLWILQLCYIGANDLPAAERAATEALKIAKKAGLEDQPHVANILHCLAHIKNRQKEFDVAECLAIDSLELHFRVHGKNHPETAFAWRTLAIALEANERLTMAGDAFRKAFDIFWFNFDENHQFVHVTGVMLVELLRRTERHDEVRALREQYPRIAPLLAATIANEHWRQGLSLAGSGQREEAIRQYTLGLKKLKPYVTAPDENEQQWHLYAVLLTDRGRAHLGLGEIDEGYVDLLDAQSVLETLLQEFPLQSRHAHRMEIVKKNLRHIPKAAK